MIEEMIGRCFVSRDAAHARHFTTKSYAEHMALDTFYSEVIGIVDEIVEVHQGRSGLIDPIQYPARPNPNNIVQHLLSECDWIEANRSSISEGSETVGALVDDLAALYRRTIYKLENLK